MSINIILTAYNMGADATEADFDEWASYVAANIEKDLSLSDDSVSVDMYPFRGGPVDDTIDGGTEIQTEEIRGYLGVVGWEAFCFGMAQL